MTLDRHRSELVIGPDASGATAERAVAARRLVWRNGKSEANCSAVTGTVERRRWRSMTHGLHSCVSVPSGIESTERRKQIAGVLHLGCSFHHCSHHFGLQSYPPLAAEPPFQCQSRSRQTPRFHY